LAPVGIRYFIFSSILKSLNAGLLSTIWLFCWKKENYTSFEKATITGWIWGFNIFDSPFNTPWFSN
jgi:hypothetical protein